MDDSSSSYSDEEVGVIARGRRLWVRGVRPHTTCADVVQALRHAPEAGGACDGEGVCACAGGGTQWVLAERWRGVERPLPQDACVLDVLAAWGDARHEVRLSLRRASSGEEDSGRDSDECARRDRKHKDRRRAPTPPPRPRRQPRDPAARLAAVIQHQSRTIHQQLDKLRIVRNGCTLVQLEKRTLMSDNSGGAKLAYLRPNLPTYPHQPSAGSDSDQGGAQLFLSALKEQEKLIDELEDQTHKNRMEKHGTNYLLESYLSDLGRCNEVNDSQAGNSDSGVGVGSGTPPRRHTKHKSRRERHLMREHYFTKELTDICQVNADRLLPIQNDTDSEASTDELTRIKEEIGILEKMAIINKRLHREEELVVRLTAKVKRYMDENRVNSCQTVPQVKTMLDKIQEELDITTKQMHENAAELTNAECEIENRMKILEELTVELEKEESQNIILEKHLKEAASRHPIALQDNYVPLLGPSADIVLQNYSGTGYVLDTLV
ncbi:Ras association domain-containing protein 10 [Eumeta japonica]|uniref:Ras association domain-containing protein 10 n=1 Tax=Eumeta variegata TaxID=151549 RepID=A0A4C1TVN0_EUMVA|nr:Ras association domain-containing protein 10 [Eumeta japonica]